MSNQHIPVAPGIALPESELSFTYVRSPGAGGQNVNKVATAAQLRFDVRGSDALPEPVKARLLEVASHLATNAGEIVITAHRFRTQEANRRDAIARLVDLIRRAAVRQKPRVPTRPTRSATRKRLENKRRRSDVKQRRGRVSTD
ncbi:MAG: alternative ribosome rescue aminoacyl-tRNA hydrolase ArfB [Pseudomonadota bacterium]